MGPHCVGKVPKQLESIEKLKMSNSPAYYTAGFPAKNSFYNIDPRLWNLNSGI
jgi:hypothetical protein